MVHQARPCALPINPRRLHAAARGYWFRGGAARAIARSQTGSVVLQPGHARQGSSISRDLRTASSVSRVWVWGMAQATTYHGGRSTCEDHRACGLPQAAVLMQQQPQEQQTGAGHDAHSLSGRHGDGIVSLLPL
jgi:hypothetical protein